MAMHTVGETTYVYIVNTAPSPGQAGSIERCIIDKEANGSPLFGCRRTLSLSPVDITINTMGATTYAYITDSVANIVQLCLIDNTNGELFLCRDSGAGAIFDKPSGIRIQTSGSTERAGGVATIAYIGNLNSSSLFACRIDSDGELDPNLCQVQNDVVGNNLAITTIDTDFGPLSLLYAVSGPENLVTRCFISDNNTLILCENANVEGLANPSYLAFARRTHIIFNPPVLYIGNDDNIVGCDIDSIGLAQNCTTDSNTFTVPDGMAFY